MTESYSFTMSVAALIHSLIMKTLPHRTASETMQLPSAETELGTDSRTSRKRPPRNASGRLFAWEIDGYTLEI